MTATLTRWEHAHGGGLESLRRSVADESVLLRLLETSCLLELSRLACAQPALDLYARLGVEIICEFFPADWCALTISAPGLPPVQAWGGSVEAAVQAGAGEAVELVLRAEEAPVGSLSFRGSLGGATPAVLSSLADQFSTALGTVIDAEGLRQRAALAEAQLEQLRWEAESDPLTLLPNRRRAERELDAALAHAQRAGSPLAVLMLDLDHFKWVNDALGHAAGDAVLRAAAGAMSAVVRGDDLAARLGGEEFLVVCPGAGDAEAVLIAERLLRAVPEACASLLPADRPQTVSIGIAGYPAARSASALLQAADEALYRVKRSGRNNWAAATPG